MKGVDVCPGGGGGFPPPGSTKFVKNYIVNTAFSTLTGKTLRLCELPLLLEDFVRFCPFYRLDRVWGYSWVCLLALVTITGETQTPTPTHFFINQI